MSGGFGPAFLQSAKDSPAEGINSLFGTNLLGAGGASNDQGTRWMNGVLGLNVMNAGSPQSDAMAAANAIANPSKLPPPAGNINPHFYNPNSFIQRQPSAPGIYNQMAAQLAGPQYNPQLLHPAVQQAMQGQNQQGTSGMKGGMQNPMFGNGMLQAYPQKTHNPKFGGGF